MAVFVVWPNNRSPEAIGYRDKSRAGHVNPLIVHKDLVLAVPTSPVGVSQSITVAECAARFALFGFQLLKPPVHFRIGLRILSVWIAS